MLLNSFIAWFNRNVRGETIYTATDATMRKRIDQFVHIKKLSVDEKLALALALSIARVEVAK